MLADKREIRRKILALRGNLTEDERNQKSDCIVQRLIGWELYQQAKTLAVFISFGDEADLSALIDHAVENEKEVLIPRVVDRKNGQLRFYRFTGWDQLETGAYGIREPDPKQAEAGRIEELDLIITPGVAFDRTGSRLGYGGGYYDRFFASLSRECREMPPRAGVGFELQIVDQIPVESFDVRLTHLVTEKEIYQFS
ncbi:MAG: 5-formyltetrahydrofolate cyclo-ligase [Bacillaceae bacterium]|nr:5-formyltetrahydrofolate cyclo-ligase [Bacillaceae bacterium]